MSDNLNDTTLGYLADNGMVIDYVVSLKFMTDEGSVRVRNICTESLNSFEAIGMLTSHLDDLRMAVCDYHLARDDDE